MNLLPLALPILIFSLAGCLGVHPRHGGSSIHQAANGARTELKQPENSSQPTTQEVLEISSTVIPQEKGQGTNLPPVLIDLRHTKTTFGAVHRDTAGEMGARLAATSPLRWVGIAMLLAAGAVGYFTGRWKAPAILAASGIGLIVLASVIPGHELMLISIGLAVALIILLFEAHIHHWFTPK